MSQPPEYGQRPRVTCFKKIYLLPEFLSYRGVTYLDGNPRIGAKK
jgi:hypothetical protein